MNAELIDNKRRWIAAAAGATLVLALLLMLARVVRIQPVVALQPPPPRPVIEIRQSGGRDKVVDEEAIISDQRPLFLPTERNVRLTALPRPETGKSIMDRDVPRLTYGDTALNLNLPDPVNVGDKPVEALLADANPPPLSGFGRLAGPVAPLEARGGFVEVLRKDTNRRVLAQQLPLDARPPINREKADAWRPMEFFAAVNSAGLVGSLVLTERSDVEEVNAYFRDYLVRTFRLGERLPPGYYRIIVGP